MNEWLEKTLGDVAEIIGGFAFKGEHFSDSGDEFVIKIKDIKSPIVDVVNATKVFLAGYPKDRLKKYKIRKGDFVVAMTGATIGKVGRLQCDLEAYVNQRVAKIEPSDNADKHFIYYAINNNDFQSFIQNNIDSHSAQENISSTSIGRYPIFLPSLPEQRAIAGVLSSLDDKIDLLHRQNATLEAMAETLFHLKFLEGANQDWPQGKLEDLFLLQRGFDLPTQNREAGEYPIYAASGFSGCHSEYKVKGPGVTTGRSGLLGKVFFVLEDFWPLNTSLYVKEFKKGSPLFSYFVLKNIDLESFNAGSAVPTLNRNHVHNYSIPIPPDDLISEFETLTRPSFEKIRFNKIQIETLQKIRDTLLPKLMSGEVRVRH